MFQPSVKQSQLILMKMFIQAKADMKTDQMKLLLIGFTTPFEGDEGSKVPLNPLNASPHPPNADALQLPTFLLNSAPTSS